MVSQKAPTAPAVVRRKWEELAPGQVQLQGANQSPGGFPYLVPDLTSRYLIRRFQVTLP